MPKKTKRVVVQVELFDEELHRDWMAYCKEKDSTSNRELRAIIRRHVEYWRENRER